MDRELIRQPSLTLIPAACGWRSTVVTARGESSGEAALSFAEAVAAGEALAAELRLDPCFPAVVTLPARLGVFERLTLPSCDGAELAGMVRLQFEKSLPYPVEEAAFGWQILSQTASQTTLLACAAHEAAVTTLCAPLLERRFPQRLTFWALHAAAQAADGSTACGLWREGTETVFGIFENRRLGFVEILDGDDPLAALPRTLIGAEMAGAPTDFSEVFLDADLMKWKEPLAAFLGAPVAEWTAQANEPPPGEAVDLVPELWRTQQKGREAACRRRRRIVAAALVYGAVLLAAVLSLFFGSRRLESLEKEIAALHPGVDALIDRQSRWNALAPAVDPRRFAVELLFQTYQCLPSPETRLTRFELADNQLSIEGEAPDARQAIAFAESLKTRPGLGGYHFESGPPVLLPNEHAQFRIFGKP